jgi:hypothetical protein
MLHRLQRGSAGGRPEQEVRRRAGKIAWIFEAPPCGVANLADLRASLRFIAMGHNATFIIATEPEALEYVRSQSGLPSDDVLAARPVGTLELSKLLAIIEEKPWQTELQGLFRAVPSQPALTRVADELLERLTIFDYEFAQVANDWAATPEMQWPPAEAREVFEELASHAVKAQLKKKPIYLWSRG